jgi:flagellar motility protein MotE (MotC chaperone)
MRAIELPSPRDLGRQLSPLPVTLAGLVALLALKLAGFAPAPTTAEVAVGAVPLADVAPAAAPATPAATSDHPEPETVASPRAPAAILASARETAEQRTARMIDDLLAPAAGGGPGAGAARVAAEENPLAAEPFLAERRALARQRESLNVRQLAIDVAEKRLRGLIEELSALKREIDARLAELEAGDRERLARLVKLYEKMRPKDAARIFDDLDFEVLVPLALAMNERKLAPIVAAMAPDVARKLTGEVAEQRADASLAAVVAASRR